MNEFLKTIVFIGVAAVSALLASLTFVSNKPPSASGFELVGTPFFEDLTTVSQVTALELFARNESAGLESFVVQKVDGLWRIPSHNDYPAEAADRLARTSTGVTGLVREALAGRLKSDHARLGVLDPKDPEIEEPENAGKRVTLKGEGGQILADFIIGKQVVREEKEDLLRPFEQLDKRNQFYVRRADETQTYIVPLDMNISTRFADWIDTKLLPVDLNDIVSVNIDNYDLINNPRDPLGVSRIKKVGDKIALTRNESFGPWQMTGLDETQETLKVEAVNSLLQTLVDLKIVGVRPKFEFDGQTLIDANLKLNQSAELTANPEQYAQIMAQMQADLSEKGLYLQAVNGDVDRLELISEFGQLNFTTNAGIVFSLDFGKSIDGDSSFIEIGTPSGAVDETAQSASDDVESDAANANETDEAQVKNSGVDPISKNRYVWIRVSLDPEKVGDGVPVKPTPPTEPVKPEGYKPATTDKEAGDDAPPKIEQEATGNQEEKSTGEANQETEKEQDQDAKQDQATESDRNPSFVAYEQSLAMFEQAKTQYEVELSMYESQVKAHAEQVATSQKQVDILNERIGAWYYVVAADNLGQLRLDRPSLVQPAAPPPTAPSPDGTPPIVPSPLQPKAIDGQGSLPPATELTIPDPIKSDPPANNAPPAAKEKQTEQQQTEQKQTDGEKKDDGGSSEKSPS